MESLLGDTPAEQNKRLRKLVWLLLVLLIFTVAGSILSRVYCSVSGTENVSIGSQNCSCGGEEREVGEDVLVINGIGYWVGNLSTGDRSKLVIIEALRNATKRNISQKFGEEFLVSFNNTIVTYNFKTGFYRQAWDRPAEKALFFNKSCVPPATLINERCSFYPTEKASWYEAYAKCGLLGLRIAMADLKLFTGGPWHSAMYIPEGPGIVTPSSCYHDLRDCFKSKNRTYYQSTNRDKDSVSVYDKLGYVCGES